MVLQNTSHCIAEYSALYCRIHCRIHLTVLQNTSQCIAEYAVLQNTLHAEHNLLLLQPSMMQSTFTESYIASHTPRASCQFYTNDFSFLWFILRGIQRKWVRVAKEVMICVIVFDMANIVSWIVFFKTRGKVREYASH